MTEGGQGEGEAAVSAAPPRGDHTALTKGSELTLGVPWTSSSRASLHSQVQVWEGSRKLPKCRSVIKHHSPRAHKKGAVVPRTATGFTPRKPSTL